MWLRFTHANALRGRIFPTCPGYFLRWICRPFAYHTKPLLELFATLNSIQLKVAVSPFLKNRGNIYVYICPHI
jgi:hypothetical protein